uniref:type II toxin-antitoxin system RelE family toxin n=1 Tax=Paenibacillus oryzisoli TaxID=1850517 RepID=UPI003D2BFBE4
MFPTHEKKLPSLSLFKKILPDPTSPKCHWQSKGRKARRANSVIRCPYKQTRNRILNHIQILAQDPKHPELYIKKMQGTNNQFRLRIGSYRVVYSIFNDILVIVVIKVGSRGDVYKA